ncbi:MAG: VCBS repeat-containing protein [Candidatus Eisenbacteria bacterium]|nr:VCBS repeat-containing protein [Candidatus Eisenbacteria bacterium]
MPFPSPAIAAALLSIDDSRLLEGNSGIRTMTFKVHLSAPAATDVFVDYTTQDGTATVADQDYDLVSGTLDFAPGATIATLYVTIHGDTKVEGNEWFKVELTNPVGAGIGRGEAFGTIVNDDETTFTLIAIPDDPYYGGTLPTSFGDYDNDGVPDLPPYKVQAYGGLIDIPGFRELLADGNYHGGAWCDYDRDGDLDFIILGYSGIEGATITPTPTRLLRNDGAAGFVDVAPSQGMNIIGAGETPAWGDFDGDGWPDLFTPYYGNIPPYRSFLYHNNGDGTFTDMAAAAGVDLPGIPPQLRPEGATVADWNDDGHLDLYVASHLFQNDGTGHFTDVRAAVGLPVLFDEGAAWIDYDNDGDLDLFLRGLDGPHLFRNDGGHFTEVTAAAGLGPIATFWGDSWADADGDGDLDLLLVLGDNSTRLMLNQGDGTFVRDPFMDQFNPQADFSAWADIDGDGDVDLAMGGNGSIKRLFRNSLQGNPGYPGSHLAVTVVDSTGHWTELGATVRLHQIDGPPGTTQTRVVGGGAAYMAENEYVVHFGGLASGRYALEIVYPSPAGRRIVVDSLANPILGRLEPSAMAEDAMIVYEDGRVALIAHPHIAGVTPALVRGGTDRLGMPTPSPARVTMTIPVELHAAGRAALAIYDLAGRLVRRLDRGIIEAGVTPVVWDLRDDRGARVPTGVYLGRLTVDGRLAAPRRLLVVR